MITNKLIFLSHLLTNDSPTYANNGIVNLQKTKSIQHGDSCNEGKIEIGNHVGTHIDAPFHFDDRGLSIDSYDADFWKCKNPFLIQYTAEPKQSINLNQISDLLESIPEQADLLLLKTGFQVYRDLDPSVYCFENPAITPEVGIWLRENRKNVRFFGFDFISLSSRAYRELGKKSHEAFLSSKNPITNEMNVNQPILLIEDMKLDLLATSPITVFVVPLRFEQADGSPVTVLAELQEYDKLSKTKT